MFIKIYVFVALSLVGGLILEVKQPMPKKETPVIPTIIAIAIGNNFVSFSVMCREAAVKGHPVFHFSVVIRLNYHSLW